MAAILFTFGAVAAVGARDAARGVRVLGSLQPLVAAVNGAGQRLTRWVIAEGATVGWVATGLAVALAGAGLLAGGRRALPLVLVGGAGALAVWGQIMLLAGQPWQGTCLYALGIACAAALGVWYPLTRLDGWPRLPEPAVSEDAPQPAAAPRVPWLFEWALVLALALAAVLTRTYALTELPHAYDLEMVDSVIMSRTVWSVGEYFRGGFMANSAGIVHLLPGPLLFAVFGTSIFTVRLVAVLFGVAAVPLLYWLVRRVAGIGAATVSALLLVAAPEHLYWSRVETGGFIPIAVLALITVHVGLTMIRRYSAAALLGTALWMPIGRYGYAPAYVLVLYPLALYAHGVVCMRRVWRTAWYGVPLLAGGVAAWSLSLSLVFSYLTYSEWRFVHPAFIFGAPLWRVHGSPGFRDAGFVDLVQLQAAAMTGKLGEVIAGFWYHGPRMFSQWFQRVCLSPDHLTVLDGGVAVMFALGLGYLVAQAHVRQAFALLVWVGLGLLPAVMSDEPTTRRLAVLFPAIYAIAGVTLAAALAIVRQCAGRWLARITGAVAAVVVLAVVCTGLASHFLLRTGPTWIEPIIEFVRPLIEGSDVILHGVEESVVKAAVLGNLDSFIDKPPCVREVGDKEWITAALGLPCDFDTSLYRLTIPPGRREELQATRAPARVSFLVEETAISGPHIKLLQRLFPAAELRRGRFAEDARSLVSLTVDPSDVEALRAPVRHGAPAVGEERQPEELAGVHLRPADVESPGGGSGLRIEGGILVERDGWYRVALGDGCPGAVLSVSGRPNPGASAYPMLAGVYRFEITLPESGPCRLPVTLLMGAGADGALTPVGPERLASPSVAALAEEKRPPVEVYAGYGAVETLVPLSGRGLGLGVDDEGSVYVLVLGPEGWRVQRLDAQGREVTRWPVPAVPGRFVSGMAVDGSGTVVAIAETQVLLFDRDGKPQGSWRLPWDAHASDVAFAPDGRVLLAMRARDSIAVLGRDGALHGELQTIAGGPGKLVGPAAISVAPDGRMLIVQEDGRALLFQIDADPLRPRFVREFRPDFARLPIWATGGAFDGVERILIPDSLGTGPLVYGPDGRRLVAAVPERDLAEKGLGQVVKFVPVADHVYALESNRIWVIAREPAAAPPT